MFSVSCFNIVTTFLHCNQLGRGVLGDITNVEATSALLESQSSSQSSELASDTQPSHVPEPTVLAQACKSLKEVQRTLTSEKKQHITSAEVKFMCKGWPTITGSGRRAKSWELNYPAIAFMINGGYYSDYASMMGTMGLPVMHHSTWENPVSWVGPHVEQLAKWSCEQVRADIEKREDHLEWMAGFDGFYLTRGIILIMLQLHCTMCILTILLGLLIVQSVARTPTGRVHHLVQKVTC